MKRIIFEIENKKDVFKAENFKDIENFIQKNGIKNFVFVMDKIAPVELGDNSVLLSGEVGYDITVETITPFLKAGKKILLDSFGGGLMEGWQIHDLIKDFYPDTEIGILGAAYSSAMQIFLAAKKENRTASKNSTGLIHAPWTFAAGNDTDFKEFSELLEKDKIKLINFYSKESGLSNEIISEIMKKEEVLSYDRMIELNLINPESQEKQQTTEPEQSAKVHNSNINSNKMDKNQKDALNLLDKTFKAFQNLFAPKIKNIVLQDTNGVELDFDVESEAEIMEGTKVTANGQPANGTFELITFSVVAENGMVTSKVDKTESSDETEALQTEIADLKTQLETSQNSISEKENELIILNQKVAEMQAAYTKVSNEFVSFKTKFSKTPEKPVNKVEQTVQVETEKKKVSINLDKVRAGVSYK